MAVALHRRGPNGKLMVAFDRGTDALWVYVGGWTALACVGFAFLAQTRGRFAHWRVNLGSRYALGVAVTVTSPDSRGLLRRAVGVTRATRLRENGKCEVK